MFGHYYSPIHGGPFSTPEPTAEEKVSPKVEDAPASPPTFRAERRLPTLLTRCGYCGLEGHSAHCQCGRVAIFGVTCACIRGVPSERETEPTLAGTYATGHQ